MTNFGVFDTASDVSENVLDHGQVRLISSMGSDLAIIRAARVSYAAAWRTGENEDNDTKLLRRLWRGKPEPGESFCIAGGHSTKPALPSLPKHSTPFEAVTMTFEIVAPIFVFRQWHRHRTQSYNELSARYREMDERFYIPALDVIGVQSVNNKQGRDTTPGDHLTPLRAKEIEAVRSHHEHSFILYRSLLASGWPKELARTVLGVGVYSHMFTTMNLLNFFKFANLRADPHAQYEIRVYAEAMLSMVETFAPRAVALFREANPT